MLWRDRAGQVRICRMVLSCKVGPSGNGTPYWHLALRPGGGVCAERLSWPEAKRRSTGRAVLQKLQAQRSFDPANLLSFAGSLASSIQVRAAMPANTEAPCIRAGRVTLSCYHELSVPAAHRAQNLVHNCRSLGQGRSSVEEAKPQVPSCSLQPADYSVSHRTADGCLCCWP